MCAESLSYIILISHLSSSSAAARWALGIRKSATVGPTVWNSLPDCLYRTCNQSVEPKKFQRNLKIHLLTSY